MKSDKVWAVRFYPNRKHTWLKYFVETVQLREGGVEVKPMRESNMTKSRHYSLKIDPTFPDWVGIPKSRAEKLCSIFEIRNP